MVTPRSLLRPAAVIAVVALAAACGSSTPTGPTGTLIQTDLRLGTGAQAVAGMNLTVHYTGWLYDPTKPDFKGLQFDTSLGGDPFTFSLGSSQVIQGWDQGLVGMKAGGLRRLVIPPSLGYGSVRYASIPPYSTLVFEIDLLDVIDPNAPTSSSSSIGRRP